jgi:hypothetical protein
MMHFLIDLDHKLFIAINQTLSNHWLDVTMHVLSSKAAFFPIYLIAIFKL